MESELPMFGPTRLTYWVTFTPVDDGAECVRVEKMEYDEGETAFFDLSWLHDVYGEREWLDVYDADGELVGEDIIELDQRGTRAVRLSPDGEVRGWYRIETEDPWDWFEPQADIDLWVSAGFDRVAAESWADLGVSPASASLYDRAGVSLVEAVSFEARRAGGEDVDTALRTLIALLPGSSTSPSGPRP